MTLKSNQDKQSGNNTLKSTFTRMLMAIPVFALLALLANTPTACSYKFNGANIPDTIKTVRVNMFENRARYINPQLTQKLTEKLKQKIISQTKLSQTNGANPDWEISGFISDYSFSTSAISGQQVASNRLTVAVHLTIDKRRQDKTEEIDVMRSFEFKGDQSFQQAEQALGDEIIRNLTDEIFNRLFSNW